MNFFLTLAAVSALISLSALCIYMITFLKNTTESINKSVLILSSVEKQISEIRVSLQPTLELANKTLEKTIQSAEIIEDNMSSLKSVFDKSSLIIDRIETFQEKIHQQIEPPVLNGLTTINSLLKGLFSALQYLRKS